MTLGVNVILHCIYDVMKWKQGTHECRHCRNIFFLDQNSESNSSCLNSQKWLISTKEYIFQQFLIDVQKQFIDFNWYLSGRQLDKISQFRWQMHLKCYIKYIFDGIYPSPIATICTTEKKIIEILTDLTVSIWKHSISFFEQVPSLLPLTVNITLDT